MNEPEKNCLFKTFFNQIKIKSIWFCFAVGERGGGGGGGGNGK